MLIAFVYYYYYYYYYYLHTHFLNGPSISLLNVTQISLTLEKSCHPPTYIYIYIRLNILLYRLTMDH